jgi:hypothetical protein
MYVWEENYLFMFESYIKMKFTLKDAMNPKLISPARYPNDLASSTVLLPFP